MTKSKSLPAIGQSDRDLAAMLERHEGRRAHPYRDQVGKLTIGVGRNLDDRGLSAEEIDMLLAHDIAIARAGCRALFPAFDGFGRKRQAALISMAFNLGQTRLACFRRMRAAINDGNWIGASHEALDSYWAGQVGHRAQEIATLLRSSSKPG
ncbi:glycoside hydrolase family protein [Candidatus Puniceispirillum marinum]|uniref:Lysozyme n=1 Tax=Puniceispirillum marinum (strain IMCC1322) TaxID=488538 RepID=D5BPL0_PUNMI|nr:glycoside hydrolase family protein [Candidatus Puniceispirillum marinum]ADE40512.1 chain A, D20c mutant of T4 lysozyme [Candidatus Puniceispirillum marinum IMCC1322]